MQGGQTSFLTSCTNKQCIFSLKSKPTHPRNLNLFFIVFELWNTILALCSFVFSLIIFFFLVKVLLFSIIYSLFSLRFCQCFSNLFLDLITLNKKYISRKIQFELYQKLLRVIQFGGFFFNWHLNKYAVPCHCRLIKL